MISVCAVELTIKNSILVLQPLSWFLVWKYHRSLGAQVTEMSLPVCSSCQSASLEKIHKVNEHYAYSVYLHIS